MGGAFLRIVAESSRECCAGRRSGELLPFWVPVICEREGILEGLFCVDDDVDATEAAALKLDETELDIVCRDTLAP